MRQPRQFGLSFSSLVAGSGVAALVLVVVLVLVLSERTHERLPSVSLPAPPPPVIASIDERRADGAPADRPSAHAREETPTPPRIPLRADPPPAIPAWERYAVAAPQRNGRPWVAIVVDDMGLDRSRSARVIALPGPLTLAFLPYARDLERQTAAARAAGHELLLHLPMEPEGSENPGPDALRTDQDDQEILRRTVADLERFGSYVGVNNHMGSRFTRDARAMRPVMAELACAPRPPVSRLADRVGKRGRRTCPNYGRTACLARRFSRSRPRSRGHTPTVRRARSHRASRWLCRGY